MKNDPIGTRIKKNYEDISRFKLTRRTPVIGRIDGRSFHTFTKGMERPWDKYFIGAMIATAHILLKEIQGCKLAYIQSDEISLLLTDYDNLDTDAWFDYNLQKMCSVAASIATGAFNNAIKRTPYYDKYPAHFDTRFFNIPKEEVCNYFIWREQDSTRNSVQMLGQHHFSHKELQNVSAAGIQDKLILEKGINWNNLEPLFKRGACVTKEGTDYSIPIFTQDREYIERFI